MSADDGDYIILRLPIAPDMTADDAGNGLRYWAAYQHLYKKQISEWCAALLVQYREAYRHLDVTGLLR